MNYDFTFISKTYKKISSIQSSAAKILLSLLNIQKNQSILDVGCGTGNLTKEIYEICGGDVVGIDPSCGMIDEAKRQYGNDILFDVGSAEDIAYKDKFDVIFCNSSFQWIKNLEKAVKNFYLSLKDGGKIGIQAPATNIYCPNFIDAIDEICRLESLKSTFEKFNSPWNFLQTAEEYSCLFEKQGFEVLFSQIQTIETYHTPEKVYEIFCSGAMAGYLNQKYYDCHIDEDYTSAFLDNIQKAFMRQAEDDGKIRLVFHRIFLIAAKR